MHFSKKWETKDCSGDNNERQLLQWAAISAFLVLLGDLIAFILAVIATQNNSNRDNNCPIKEQVKSLEEKIASRNKTNQEIIKILEEKIKELKTTL